MDDLSRFWSDVIGRLSGPLSFRFILQPVMATLYALRDGIKDARGDRPPYFWAIFYRSGERAALLREGWGAVARVILLGVVMDGIYQWMVFRWIYPLEMVVVALALAFVPYLILRGPLSRLAQVWLHRKSRQP